MEIAPGIFLFTTPGYGDVGLDGNSIAILSRDGVRVFDANWTPGASAAVLAEIRKRTDQPVRRIVKKDKGLAPDQANGPLTDAIAPIPPR
jgi:hypothetical protein